MRASQIGKTSPNIEVKTQIQNIFFNHHLVFLFSPQILSFNDSTHVIDPMGWSKDQLAS